MAMSASQVRLPKAVDEQISRMVKNGMYATKSDVIRDAVRKLVLDQMVGTLPNTGDSVKEVRKIRKILSKKRLSLKRLNSL